MDTKSTTALPSRFLLALPIFNQGLQEDERTSGNEPDESLPWNRFRSVSHDCSGPLLPVYRRR